MMPQKTPRAARYTDEEDEGGEMMIHEPFKVYTSPVTATHYDVYLSNPFIEPAYYDDLCQLLRRAGENDTVRMYLNTPGGDMAAGLAIIQAMRESKATITTVLHPMAFSMGALMFLCGDKQEAAPGSILMFHTYSSGLSGKGSEQVAEVHANNAWFECVLKETCMPFLTRAELKSLMQGKDLWLQYPEIEKRLAAMRSA